MDFPHQQYLFELSELRQLPFYVQTFTVKEGKTPRRPKHNIVATRVMRPI